MASQGYDRVAQVTDKKAYQGTATTAAPRGAKHESGRAAETQKSATDENYSFRSNFCVAEGTASSVEMASQSTTQMQRSAIEAAGTHRPKCQWTSRHKHPSIASDDSTFSKASLSFILDDEAATAVAAGDCIIPFRGKLATASLARSRSTGDLSEELFSKDAGVAQSSTTRVKQGVDGKRRARRPPSRICKYDGCDQYVVDQGLCVRHGGGKRCQTPGCKSRAKHQNRCWKHGGSIECKIPSCLNRAKSRGFCWSHGGGTKCKADSCEKIAISNGLCWAHGGGKRCIVEGCMRQAYERTENLCNSHFLKLPHDEEEVGDGMANTELTLEQYLELAAPPGN